MTTKQTKQIRTVLTAEFHAKVAHHEAGEQEDTGVLHPEQEVREAADPEAHTTHPIGVSLHGRAFRDVRHFYDVHRKATRQAKADRDDALAQALELLEDHDSIGEVSTWELLKLARKYAAEHVVHCNLGASAGVLLTLYWAPDIDRALRQLLDAAVRDDASSVAARACIRRMIRVLDNEAASE